jgi:hypothetical protein
MEKEPTNLSCNGTIGKSGALDHGNLLHDNLQATKVGVQGH